MQQEQYGEAQVIWFTKIINHNYVTDLNNNSDTSASTIRHPTNGKSGIKTQRQHTDLTVDMTNIKTDQIADRTC